MRPCSLMSSEAAVGVDAIATASLLHSSGLAPSGLALRPLGNSGARQGWTAARQHTGSIPVVVTASQSTRSSELGARSQDVPALYIARAPPLRRPIDDMACARQCCHCVIVVTSAWLFAVAYCAFANSFFEEKIYISPKDLKWPTAQAQLEQWALNQTAARRALQLKKSDSERKHAPLTIAQDPRANVLGVAFIVTMYICCQTRKVPGVRAGVRNLEVKDDYPAGGGT